MKDSTRAVGLIAVLLLVASGCAGHAQGDSGQVAMMPFFDEEVGVRGVEPVEGWSDQAHLIRDQMRGTIEDMKALALEQISWKQMPATAATYKGRGYTWQIYSGMGQVYDAGDELLHLEIGLAEDDSMAYVIALLVVPEHYEAHTEMCDSVFAHAIYAFEPMS